MTRKKNSIAFHLMLALALILFFRVETILGQQNHPDYTSKVPKYTFGSTLEEQGAQLKTNPLMLRLIESRKKLAGDRFRPRYHYVNPEGNLNDPNGLCYWKGIFAICL